MRILLISDICWDESTYKFLRHKVELLKPVLILVAGDLFNQVVANGSDRAYKFFKFANAKKIKSFVIQGNWDENEVYDDFIAKTKDLQYVEEISGRIVEFDGLKILGIPYSMTEDLKVVRELPSLFPEKVDIVLTHALFRNRVWLFDLNTQYIITGHFDSQLCLIRNKIFISFYTFPHDYAVLDFMPSKQTLTYYGGVARGKSRDEKSVAQIKKGALVWSTKPLSNSNNKGLAAASPIHRLTENYASSIESLITAREFLEMNILDGKEIIEKLLYHGLPKSHIKDYIGRFNLRRNRAEKGRPTN